MVYDEKALTLYTNFVKERHQIYLARQINQPQPWTTDPTLASQKFTNVFRVLDPGSQFVLTDLGPVGYSLEADLDFITRCVFYRVTNLPATWRYLRENLGHYPGSEDFLDEPERIIDLLHARRDAGTPVFSGAYIIIPQPGTTNDKIEGAVYLTQNFITEAAEEFSMASTSKERYDILRSVPGIGNFLAMQILTDWGYGQIVSWEDTFISAGPGAIRGAKHLNPDIPAEAVIRGLTEMWEDDESVHLDGYYPSLMDVQNTLCEFSKYWKFAVNGKPRSLNIYKPAHPGVQPKPVLPVWMTV